MKVVFLNPDTAQHETLSAKFVHWTPMLDLAVLDRPEIDAMTTEEIKAQIGVDGWWAVFKQPGIPDCLSEVSIPMVLLTKSTLAMLPPHPDRQQVGL